MARWWSTPHRTLMMKRARADHADGVLVVCLTNKRRGLLGKVAVGSFHKFRWVTPGFVILLDCLKKWYQHEASAGALLSNEVW
jgi:hypothetical protein